MLNNKNRITLALSLVLSGHVFASEYQVVDSKTDLGILKSDNSGFSSATAVSADGRVVIGRSDTDGSNENAFVWREGDSKMTGLGTLKSDNSGTSSATAVSADGRMVVGFADTDSGAQNAFVWREGDSKMTGLGTLKSDNSGHSSADAVSADGRVVVGNTDTDGGSQNAFVWHEGDSKMTSLGTLKSDNSGTSLNSTVSANGRVVVGRADTDGGSQNAFVWREGDSKMTGLGTLKSDNSGTSSANAVSADGRVVAGRSDTDGSDENAFVWREGDSKMTGLGTLKSDNSGTSSATAISADGRVVVGRAETDGSDDNAFVWREGDSKMTSLGTLKSDNSGFSYANAVSADGRVVVGDAETDSGDKNAFMWREGDSKMTSLGTLKSDNSGTSSANAVSADGRVVVGFAETDADYTHATVWKIKYPVPPIDPVDPPVVIVDATNSGRAMADTGRRGFKVLDLYQGSLNNLSQSRCQLSQSEYCVGVFSQYDTVSSNHRIATGLFGAIRLPAENWTVGGALNFANSTSLVDNYDTRGSNQPGVGVFTRYQQNRDNTGLSAELSGAFLQQGLTITRDKRQNTEAGEGDSRIKGYQANLSLQYGVAISPSTLVSPGVAFSYRNIARDGYTETRNAEFAAEYGKMGNTRTDLRIGVSAIHQLNATVQLDGNLGATVKLHSERDAFTGRIPYIGAYAYDAGDERTVNPYVSAGININVTKNSTVRANAGWQQTDYRHDAASVGVSYSYHW